MTAKFFEDIWNKIAEKDSSGNLIIRYESEEDIIFLYSSGFVDAEKFSLDDWVDAFKESRQQDGSYHVTHPQWLDKQKYYYAGPILEPFNALKIPEREYTTDELIDLFKTCIVPSSQMSEDKIPILLQEYEKQGLLKDGKFQMTMKQKKDLHDSIKQFPSPLHVLEVNVERMQQGATEPTVTEVSGARDSQFVHGASASKTATAQLESLLGGKTKPAPSLEGKETVSLKDLQKRSVKRRPV